VVFSPHPRLHTHLHLTDLFILIADPSLILPAMTSPDPPTNKPYLRPSHRVLTHTYTHSTAYLHPFPSPTAATPHKTPRILASYTSTAHPD
jgi:hypothetical protein